jgi:tetratricopeptide (TPR) repeat protein
MIHLGTGEIQDFLASRLDAAVRRRVVLHLLGGCTLCHRRVKTIADPILGKEPWSVAEPVAEDCYNEALARACAAARAFLGRWRKDKAKLDRALALLDQAPEGLEDVRFPSRQAQALHGWPLCEALLQKSYESRFSDPKRMLNLADSAAGVAEHIRPERYPWPSLLSDLRARAFAELGNAYRVNNRHVDADASFERALEFLDEGTGDPLLRARVMDLQASLRRAQRRLEEAIALLDEVHGLYLEAGESHLAGRALISIGLNTYYRGFPRQAVAFLQKGSELLEPNRDRQLQNSTALGIIDALSGCGEHRRASQRLLQSGLREAFAAEPLNLLKLQWVEGKIHAGLGRLARAERACGETRQGLLRRGQIYDAALVGMDLAAVWLRQGRTASEVRELAEEMHAVFEDLGVQVEAAKALHFIEEACRHDSITVSMIERVRTFLERLPWQPGIRFEPAAFAP